MPSERPGRPMSPWSSPRARVPVALLFWDATPGDDVQSQAKLMFDETVIEHSTSNRSFFSANGSANCYAIDRRRLPILIPALRRRTLVGDGAGLFLLPSPGFRRKSQTLSCRAVVPSFRVNPPRFQIFSARDPRYQKLRARMAKKIALWVESQKYSKSAYRG